ncbi:MAG: ABC transporter ATP-binding protein [Bacteroidota bacterium]
MAGEYVLEMRGITKTFGSVVANEDVNLKVRRGEVHALVGENGAGKSTLMKILFGLYQPDAGEIFLSGKQVVIKDPSDAIKLNIGMVHQLFMLVPSFTVAQNMILGVEPRKGAKLDLAKAEKRIEEISGVCGFAIDPKARIRDCPVGVQQRVEIMKALYRGADLLILDEPTSVLTPGEAEELFKIMRTLTRQGKTIIFITHKLREVMATAQHVTVLRRGKTVATLPIDETCEEDLALYMVGRKVDLYSGKDEVKQGEEIVSVKGLWLADKYGRWRLKDISLKVRVGEILGIAGVAGNGQDELVDVLMGLKKPSRGRIEMDGHDVTGRTPDAIRALGVGYISEDRYERSMIRDASVVENMLLGFQRDKRFNGFGLRLDAIRRWADELVREFDVQPPLLDIRAGSLSGGNAQRAVMAREFALSKRVIIACEPSQGLDIGSTDFVHRQLLDRRRKGHAIILISSDLEEMLYLADTIAVMYKGEIISSFPNRDVDENRIGLLMAGVRDAEPEEEAR